MAFNPKSTYLLFILSIFTLSAQAQWVTKSLGYVVADAAPVDNTTTFFVGYQSDFNSALLKTTNNGATVTEVSLTTTAALYRGCHFFDAQNGLVCGVNSNNQSIVWRTSNGGATLIPVVIAQSEFPNPTDFYFVDRNIGYLFAASPFSGSRIFKTTNGGVSWQQLSEETSVYIADLSFLTATIGHRLAASKLQITRNEATSWQNIQTPATPSCYFFQNEQVGYIGTNNGEIWKTNNGGTTWALSMRFESAQISNIKFPTPSVGYATFNAASNAIMRTTDGGLSWKTIYQDNGTTLQAVDKLAFLNENRGAAVGLSIAAVTTNAATMTAIPTSTLTISGSDTSCSQNIKVRLDMTGTPPWNVILSEPNNTSTIQNYRVTQTPAFVSFIPTAFDGNIKTVVPVSIKGVADPSNGQIDGSATLVSIAPNAAFKQPNIPDSPCVNTILSVPIRLTGCPPWSLRIYDDLYNNTIGDTIITNIMDSIYIYKHLITNREQFRRIDIREVKSGDGEWQTVNAFYYYYPRGPKGDAYFSNQNNLSPCLDSRNEIKVFFQGAPPFSASLTNGTETLTTTTYENSYTFNPIIRRNSSWSISRATDFCGSMEKPQPIDIAPIPIYAPSNIQASYTPQGDSIDVTWRDNNTGIAGFTTQINVSVHFGIDLGVQKVRIPAPSIWNPAQNDSFRLYVTAIISDRNTSNSCEKTASILFPSPIRLINKGNFSQTPPNSGVVAADFNGDNLPDILAQGGFYVNNGSFSFTYRPQDFGGNPSVVGDIDNDGDLDFLVNNAGDNSTKVYVNNGNFAFLRQQTLVGANATLIDHNFDGLLDIAATGKTYKNNGSNNFTIIASGFGSYGDMRGKSYYFDLNSDGRVDLIDVYNSNPSSEDSANVVINRVATSLNSTAWENKGDIIEEWDTNNSFKNFIAIPQSISWGNFYGGQEALFLFSSKSNSSSNGTTAEPITIISHADSSFSIDPRGRLFSIDSLASTAEGLMVNLNNSRGKQLLFNNKFITNYETGLPLSGLNADFIAKGAPASADFDNDGDLDIVVPSQTGGMSVYETKRLTKNTWLKVKLKGQTINKAGLGAKITVYTSPQIGTSSSTFTQTDVATIGGLHGGKSRSDIVAHFGLDTITLIDSIKVRWSPTSTSTLFRIAVNQTLLIEEDKDYSCAQMRVSPNYNKLVGCNQPLVLSIPTPRSPNVRYTWTKQNQNSQDSLVAHANTLTLTNVEQSGLYRLFAKDTVKGCERRGDAFQATISKPKISVTLLDTIDCTNDKGRIQISGYKYISHEYTFVELFDPLTRTWSEAFQSPLPDRPGDMNAGRYRGVTYALQDTSCRAVSPIFTIQKDSFVISGTVTLPNNTPSVSSLITLIYTASERGIYYFEVDTIRTSNLGKYAFTVPTKGFYRIKVDNGNQASILTTYYGNTTIKEAGTVIDGTNCGAFAANIKFVSAACSGDLVPPVIQCPANQSITTLNTTDVCSPANLLRATATDNCGAPVITINPIETTCFPVGTTTLTHTATDLNGNKSTCQNTITVVRRTRPIPLLLKASEHTVMRNTNVCVTISADSFMNIASMQFTIQFDPTIIDFQSIQPNTNTGFSARNFGLSLINDGLILVAWTPTPLSNHTFPNGTKLFDICFKSKSLFGTTSPIKFVGSPNLPIEITRGDQSFTPISLKEKNGFVTVVKDIIIRHRPSTNSPRTGSIPDELTGIFRVTADSSILNLSTRKLKSNIQVYPNPTNDVLNLVFDKSVNKESKVLIYNSLGIILKEIVVLKEQTAPLSISVINWQEGSYWLRFLQNGEEISVQKFMIIR